MSKYIVIYHQRFDNIESMSEEELNKQLCASIIEANSYGDAHDKFFEERDEKDYRICNIVITE